MQDWTGHNCAENDQRRVPRAVTFLDWSVMAKATITLSWLGRWGNRLQTPVV